MNPALPSALGLYRLAVARAKAQVGSTVLTYGDVPDDAEVDGRAYLIIDPDPGWDAVGRADGRVSNRRGRFHVRCCGSSKEQALAALDAARAAFLNWRPYTSLQYSMARETDADPLTIDRQNPMSPRYVLGLTYEVED